MVTTKDTPVRANYREFYTGDALKRYAAARGLPACMVITDALRTPCPLDLCVTGVRDSSRDTPEERAVETKIYTALRFL
jgi:hypothetical protein